MRMLAGASGVWMQSAARSAGSAASRGQRPEARKRKHNEGGPAAM